MLSSDGSISFVWAVLDYLARMIQPIIDRQRAKTEPSCRRT